MTCQSGKSQKKCAGESKEECSIQSQRKSAGQTAQWVVLLCKHEDLTLAPQRPSLKTTANRSITRL